MFGYRLQTKIIIVVFSIVVFCVLVSTVISLYRVNIVVEERLDAAGVFTSQTLATFCVENLLAWDYPALQLSIEQASEYDPYILAVKIYHKNNLVAHYSKDSDEDGIEYEAEVIISEVVEAEISKEERNLGVVKIVLSEKKYHAFFLQQIYSLMLLGLILGLGDTFLIFLTVNRMVLKPIKRIAEGAKIIGEGKLDHQIDVRSEDEIGRLALVLNTMTNNLRLSRDETEDYKKHLEERVDELERFRKLTIDRELKMIELKKELTEKNPNKIIKPKRTENCWDFWKCDKKLKEGCPAYTTDSGKECWLVATDYCPYLKKEFKTCYECPWFKKMNPVG